MDRTGAPWSLTRAEAARRWRPRLESSARRFTLELDRNTLTSSQSNSMMRTILAPRSSSSQMPAAVANAAIAAPICAGMDARGAAARALASSIIAIISGIRCEVRA